MDQTDVTTPNPCLLTLEEQLAILAILKKTVVRLGINGLPTAPSTTPFGASGLGPNLRINGINLDTIQDILTTSNPTFNNLLINGILNIHGYGTYWNFEIAPGGNLLITDSIDSFSYIFVDLSTGILQLAGLGGVSINGILYPISIANNDLLIGNASGNIGIIGVPASDSILIYDLSGSGNAIWGTVGVNLKLLAGALETIQNIRITDSPRFAGLGLGIVLNGADTLTNNGQLASGARKFIVDANGLPIKSNNVPLVGQGNAIIVAHGSATAQTGAITSLTSYTTLAAGSFEIGGYIDVTAFTAGTISMTCTYTDPAGNSQTLTIPLVALAGTIGTTVGSLTDAQALVISIRTSGANPITIATTVSLFTGTYNAYAWIKQIA